MALGLILSSSDMVYNDDGGNFVASAFVGGATGSATLNSALASPITSSGDFCRSYGLSVSNRPFGATTISSSVDGGVYAGPFSTSKAYSMRAWIRFTVTSENKNCGVGFLMRGDPNNFNDNRGVGEPFGLGMGGYAIRLSGVLADGQSESATIRLSFAALDDAGDDSPQIVVVADGTYDEDTWYRVRADLIPVGGAGDQINIYTSSAGDVASGQETWELVLDQFIDATADGDVYVEPDDASLGMGWYNYARNATDVSYIDGFEILVEDL